MCGRVVQRTPLQQVMALYETLPPEQSLFPPARYNIAPSQSIVAIRTRPQHGRSLGILRWGFIPAWSKDPAIGNKMINARAETVADKPAFREAFRKRRCIIPIDGFCEWKTVGKRKQPYYIQSADHQPLSLAGLWESSSPAGQSIESCTIITTTPNALMATIHNRMPVILLPEDCEKWLNPATSLDDLQTLLKPYPDGLLMAHAVNPSVNSPAHNSPGNIKPYTPPEEQGLWPTSPPE